MPKIKTRLLRGLKCKMMVDGQIQSRCPSYKDADSFYVLSIRTLTRYIAILHTHWERHRGFFVPISVYPDIFCNIRTTSGQISVKNPISGLARNGYVPILTRYRSRYREKKSDIRPDIGNIGFGKERVCPNIVPISAQILPISCPISGKMTLYRVLVTRYRKTQYRDTP